MKIKFTLAPLALLMLAGCGSQTEPSTNATTATESVGNPLTMTTPPPEVQSTAIPATTPATTPLNARDMKPDTKKYRVRGQVTGVEKSTPDGRMTLIVNHENIPDFMPAMEMRFPFAQNADAGKVKANDKIAFDMNRSTLEVSNIEKLPASAELKLKK